MNYPKPFRREGQSSLFFNYYDPLTGKRKLKSTGTSKVGESKEFIKEFIDRLTPAGSLTFREYASKFFTKETNPRYIRYRRMGKQYGMGHIKMCRSMMTKYVFPEPFADKPFAGITRGDILDLVALLMRKYPEHPSSINKVADYLSSIFSEAYYREDLKYNPAQRLGDIKYNTEQRGTFSPAEIRDMFSNPKKWSSIVSYRVFLFAAYTGRRCGEIFGLQWSQIKDGYCTIDQAYNKGEKEITDPKWGKCVTIPLCKTVLDNLPEKGESPYVFTAENGGPLYEAWWRRYFRKDMERLGIDRKARRLVPHSFRHSLNTNLLVAMIPELYVKKYIGWTDNSKDTQAIYTHIQPKDLKFVADKIDEIYSI